jgi:hypothetical protein
MGINCYDFSMNIFVGSRDYSAIRAIQASPYEWVSLFDIKKLLKA